MSARQFMLHCAHENNLLHLSVNDDIDGVELILTREVVRLAILSQEFFKPRQIVVFQRSETVF